MTIWDLGGQEVFYTLHHLFLTNYAAYLCVFDMSELLNEATRDDSIHCLIFWLQSIKMHAPEAPVFLVGTFKDKVKDSANHKQLDVLLRDVFDLEKICPKLIQNSQSKLAFWPIDNTRATNDDVLKYLKEQILKTVSDMPHVRQQVPLVWTRVYEKLMETGKPNLTLDETLQVSRTCGLSIIEELKGFLAMYHELGMLLHFDGINELHNLVVLNPQWLVDQITMVIRDFAKHPYPEAFTKDLPKNLLSHLDRLSH